MGGGGRGAGGGRRTTMTVLRKEDDVGADVAHARAGLACRGGWTLH